MIDCTAWLYIFQVPNGVIGVEILGLGGLENNKNKRQELSKTISNQKIIETAPYFF